MNIYIYDNKIQKYYKVLDKEDHLNSLEDLDFDDIKQIFKMIYFEFLFQEGLRLLISKGLIDDMGYYLDVREGAGMYKEYIINRYGERIYNSTIKNFKVDYDYQAKVAVNPSILN